MTLRFPKFANNALAQVILQQSPLQAFRLVPRIFSQLIVASILVCLVFAEVPALAVLKDNNADALNLSTSWLGGVSPTSADIVTFDSTFTGAGTLSLGDNLSWRGIQLSNPGGLVTVSDPTYSLTLGSGGIDMSAATQDFILSNAVLLGAAQAWNVGLARTLSVSRVISGTQSLVKNGNGILRLSASNTFTGSTVVNAGALVVTNSTQLGASTSPIVVTGVSSAGFAAGQLVLAGGNAGMDMSRNLSLNGRGVLGMSGAALLSVGNNTISGNILGAGATDTRIAIGAGNTTMTGTLTPGAGNLYIYGNGNLILNGLVTGNATGTGLLKTTSGLTSTLVLGNVLNNFASNLHLASGTVRVPDGGALGRSTSTQAILFNSGNLEVRSDTPNSFATRNISLVSNNGTVFVDRAVTGSSLINQMVTFGAFNFEAVGRTLTLNGRNGYGFTIGSLGANSGGNGNSNVAITTSSINGLTTLNGDVTIGDNTGVRNFTFNAQGDAIWNGNLLLASGAFIPNFTKGSSGKLTVTGTASTITGGQSINAGVLEVNQIGGASGGALNGVAGGALNLSSGILSYRGATGTGAGEITGKLINLASPTSFNVISANQSGSAPSALILSSNISATGVGSKNFYLGGTNSSINEIQGLLTDNSALNKTTLIKLGAGTWLYDPATANYVSPTLAAAGTLSTSGTATIGTNTISLSSTAGLAVGQMVLAASSIPAGTYITAIAGGSISLSAVTTGTINSGSTLNFNGLASQTSTAAATGTNTNVIPLSNTAGLVIGQSVFGGGVPTASVITAITPNASIAINNTIATSVASGTLLSFGAVSGFTGNISVAGGTLQVRPTAASGNGSDIINNTSSLTFGAEALTGNGFAAGVFEYQGLQGGSSAEILGQLVPNAGAGVVKVSGSGALTFASLGTRGAGATLDFQPGTGTIGFTTGPGTNGIVGGYATFNGVDWVTIGTNSLQYTGYTPLPSAGATSTINYRSTADINTTAAQSVNSLKLSGTQTLTLGGTLTITSGGVLFDNSTGAATIQNNGTLTNPLGASGAELIVISNGTAPNNALTINARVGGAATALTKAGSGVVVLGGSNTYTGNTTVNEGTLRLSGTSATLGAITTATNTTTLRQAATLDLNGAGALTPLYTGGSSSATVTIGALVGAGLVTNSAAANQTLAIGSSTSTQGGIFSGILQDGAGVLNVLKNGTGTEALSGLNTYTGVTVLTAGILQANILSNGGLASSIGASSNAAANLVFNGGMLQYTSASASGIYQVTQTPSVAVDRLFSLAGNGTIDSSGNFGSNVFSTAGAQNNAALIFNNTAAVGFLGAGTRTLTLQGTSTGSNEIDLQLTDNTNGGAALSVTKTGNGLWILGNNANNYSGSTTITTGQLGVTQNAASLSLNTNLALNGGVLESYGTLTRTVGTGAGQIQWLGASSGGFAASGGKLTVNLGGGSVLVFGTAGFASSTLILNSQNALFDTDFQNGLDLGATARTIQVDDNTTTGLDFATLSGVISGTGGLVKTGNGSLYITGSNTYSGSTTINAGDVRVTSIGSAGATSSNFGTNVGGGSLNIGTLAVSGYLLYYGAGETVTRTINLPGTTGGATIEASGSAPLIINTLNNTAAGAKTLTLRGFNQDQNEIRSVLADNGGVLTVTQSDGGIWVLSGSYPFSGNIHSK